MLCLTTGARGAGWVSRGPDDSTKKTLGIISVTLVGLIAVLIFSNYQIVLGSFSDLEEEDIRRNVQRVQEALATELKEIDISAKDYALADLPLETLVSLFNDHAVRETPDGNNALAGLIADLKLNIFLLADADGRYVWSRGYDEKTQNLGPVPTGLLPHLTPDNPLLRHPNSGSSLTGLVFIPEGPLLVASEYILSTGGDDAILGTVIMGRFLDDEEVEQLSELTRLSLMVKELDGSDIPEDFQDALSTVSDATPVVVRTLGDDLVAGYTVLRDVQGEPGLMVRVDVPRDIMDKGRLSMRYLLISLVAVGLVMVALIIYLLDKLGNL